MHERTSIIIHFETAPQKCKNVTRHWRWHLSVERLKFDIYIFRGCFHAHKPSSNLQIIKTYYRSEMSGYISLPWSLPVKVISVTENVSATGTISTNYYNRLDDLILYLRLWALSHPLSWLRTRAEVQFKYRQFRNLEAASAISFLFLFAISGQIYINPSSASCCRKCWTTENWNADLHHHEPVSPHPVSHIRSRVTTTDLEHKALTMADNLNAKILHFVAYDLGRHVTLMLTFQPPQSGILYKDTFPLCWGMHLLLVL